MFKKLVKAIAAIQNDNDRDECRLTVHSRKSASPLRTTSSSTVWLVWLRSLNFFAFACPF